MRTPLAALVALGLVAGAVVASGPVDAISASAAGLPVMDFTHPAAIDGRSPSTGHVVLEVDPVALLAAPGVAAAQVSPGDLPRGLSAQDLATIAALDEAGLDPRIDGLAVAPGTAPADGAAVVAQADPHVLDLGLAGVSARWVGPRHLAVRGEVPTSVLAALPGVVAVHADTPLSLASSDEHFDVQWGLENIGQPIEGTLGTAGADLRWPGATARATGVGAIVAVIDSGVELTHPDLVHAVWRNDGEDCSNGIDDDGNGYVDDCQGWDFVNADATPHDLGADNGHGTHVAGTIAARAGNGIGVAGVAPDARIMSLKVQDGGSFPSSRAAEAIRYAVDNGAQVINASWGSSGGLPSPVIAEAIAHAEAHGVLVVAAAGNDGVDIDVTPTWPAALPNANILSIAAMTNNDRLAGFSNRGAVGVDLAAPGASIASTVPGGYGWASGTSMAAPHVAGVAALLVQDLGTGDAAVLRQQLLASARFLPGLVGRVSSASTVDAAGAVGVRPGGVTVTFAGFGGLRDDAPQRIGLEMLAEGLPAEARLVRRVTLGYVHGDQLVGVVGQPVAVDGVAGATSDDALVPVSDTPLDDHDRDVLHGEGWTTQLDFALPAGTYAVLVELVDADTLAPFGQPQVGLFDVAATTTPEPEVEVAPDAPGAVLPEPPAATPILDAPGDDTGPDEVPDDEPSADGAADDDSEGSAAPSEPSADDEPSVDRAPSTDGEPSPDGEPSVVEPPSTVPTDGDEGPSPVTPTEPASPSPSPVSSPTPTPWPTPTPTASPAPAPTTAPPSTPVVVEPVVWPATGPTAGGSIVKVEFDGLPSNANVWFGNAPGHVELRTPWMLLVQTPAHRAGAVDVRVTGGQERTFPAAFTFVAPDTLTPTVPDDAVADDSPTAPGASDGGGDVLVPAPVDGPAATPDVPSVTDPVPGTETPDAPTVPGAPAPGDPAPAPSAPAVPDADAEPEDLPDARLIRGTVGRPVEVAPGLTVDPFERDEPLRTLPPSVLIGRACVATRCSGIAL